MTIIVTDCGEVIDVEAVCADAGDEYGHQLIIQNIHLVMESAKQDLLEELQHDELNQNERESLIN